MIPKVIHYCWFGGGKKSRLVQDCIKSWKLYLKDYKIIEWNESNCNLSHPFASMAFQEKKWAFLSDYIRLKVVYEQGGIYLDTDMMVCKSFNNLLGNNSFFGAEDYKYINCAIFGAVKENLFVNEILMNYNKITLDTELKDITIPKIVTSIFKKKYGDILFNKTIKQDGIVIYPNHFFYPFPFDKKKDLNEYKKFIQKESYTVHLWNGSWIEVDFSEFDYFRKREYYKGLIKMCETLKLEGKKDWKYFRKIGSSIKQSLGKKYF